MIETQIRAASQRYHVPESWIQAVIEVESAWNPQAYRAEPQIQDASRGLMQILGRTARGLGFTGDPADLFNVEINIDLGTKLLGQLRERYGDDFRRVYSAYNSGKPDLYKTSSQVAANVARAVEALSKYVTQAVDTLTASPEPSSALAILVLFVLLWKWTGKQ